LALRGERPTRNVFTHTLFSSTPFDRLRARLRVRNAIKRKMSNAKDAGGR
jgi:hypothetical protein